MGNKEIESITICFGNGCSWHFNKIVRIERAAQGYEERLLITDEEQGVVDVPYRNAVIFFKKEGA